MEWPTGTTELAPGVFAHVQATGGFCIANAGLIAGREGVTAVDALFTPAMTRTLLDEAARISPQPVDRLLNTHHHVDHTLGNAGFPAGVEILAHAKAKAEMARHGIGVLDLIRRIAPYFTTDLEGAAVRLPDTTFDGTALELRIDERIVRLLHFGTAHTVGDVMVYLPGERVLFAGDLAFFYVTPLAFEGHIGNWIRVGERILADVDADVIVPGHGPVGTRDDLRHLIDYLRLVHTSARKTFDAGATPDEAAAAIDLGEYATWGEADRLAINVRRCYQEFAGELDALL